MRKKSKILSALIALTLMPIGISSSYADETLEVEKKLYLTALNIYQDARAIQAFNPLGTPPIESLQVAANDAWRIPAGVKGSFTENSYILTEESLPGTELIINTDPLSIEPYTLEFKNFITSRADLDIAIQGSQPTDVIDELKRNNSNNNEPIDPFVLSTMVAIDKKVISLAKQYQKKNPKVTLLAATKVILESNDLDTGDVYIFLTKTGYQIQVVGMKELITTTIKGSKVASVAKGFNYNKTKTITFEDVLARVNENVLYEQAYLIVRTARAMAAFDGNTKITAKNLKEGLKDYTLPSGFKLTSNSSSANLSHKNFPKSILTIKLDSKKSQGYAIYLKGFKQTLSQFWESDTSRIYLGE
jgi:hypothetical protein